MCGMMKQCKTTGKKPSRGKEVSESLGYERLDMQLLSEVMMKQCKTPGMTMGKKPSRGKEVSKSLVYERLDSQLLSEVMVVRSTMALGMRTTPVRDHLSAVVLIAS